MGVPKFFRYYGERYPCIVTVFDGDTPLHVDNLYLDMNGIIHQCSHTNDVDLTQTGPSSDEMARAMCVYIEKLFDAVRPKKNFLMCIDGVAPRAKMNQQRQRRFRKEFDMNEAIEKAAAEGIQVPDPDSVFDSNVITPGTPFMSDFAKHFKYFIAHKIATDPSWMNLNVVFSGDEAPGEGEHKIIDFIRTRRLQPGYDANERHCLYGLDADLIMLALISHEAHFVLLREVVKFQSKKECDQKEALKKKGIEWSVLPQADQFVLLQIETFRDYLRHDIAAFLNAPASALPANWDTVENDFVLMCFLNGNDFLPSVPTCAITEGVMDVFFEIYATEILSQGRYLTNGKLINWPELAEFLHHVGLRESDALERRSKDRLMAMKRMGQRDDNFARYQSMDASKERHYLHKLEFAKENVQDSVRKLCGEWVKGVEWVWQYYVTGVNSWNWFYPYHYAPFASDLAALLHDDLTVTKVKFDMAAPFLPFQQLMGVLPPSSIKRCLPKAYHNIHLLPEFRSAFPEQLQIDTENARAPWEGVVLMPFLSEADVVRVSKQLQGTHTKEEDERNRHGPTVNYRFDTSRKSMVKVPATIEGCADVAAPMLVKDFNLSSGQGVGGRTHEPKRLPNIHPAAFGFGAIRVDPPRGRDAETTYSSAAGAHLPFSVYRSLEVTIFDKRSFNRSLILCLPPVPNPDDINSRQHLLKQWVFADWPTPRYGRVVSINTARAVAVVRKDQVSEIKINAEQQRAFRQLCNEHEMKLLEKRGIAVSVTVLVEVKLLVGFTSTVKHGMQPRFGKEVKLPLQLVYPSGFKPTPLPALAAIGKPRRTDGFGGKGLPVMYLPTTHAMEASWGCTGALESIADVNAVILVNTAAPPPKIPPGLLSAIDTSSWVALKDLAFSLNMPENHLAMVCGSITTASGFGAERDVGLCLTMKCEEKQYSRLGCMKFRIESGRTATDLSHYMAFGTRDDLFAKLVDRPGKAGAAQPNFAGRWIVSPGTAALVTEFCRKFPFAHALQEQGARDFNPSTLCTGTHARADPMAVVEKIEAFVRSSAHWDAPLVAATEEIVPPALLRQLEDSVRSDPPQPQSRFRLKLAKTLQDVYTPVFFCGEPETGHLLHPPHYDTKEIIRVGARVVNMKCTGHVPFGSRGIVVRLLDDNTTVEVVFDKVFLGGTRLGGRLATFRGSLVKRHYLLAVRSGGAPAAGPLPQAAAAHPKQVLKSPTKADTPNSASD
eukprot:gene16601-25459_t